jgi:hypothetical protein
MPTTTLEALPTGCPMGVHCFEALQVNSKTMQAAMNW